MKTGDVTIWDHSCFVCEHAEKPLSSSTCTQCFNGAFLAKKTTSRFKKASPQNIMARVRASEEAHKRAIKEANVLIDAFRY